MKSKWLHTPSAHVIVMIYDWNKRQLFLNLQWCMTPLLACKNTDKFDHIRMNDYSTSLYQNSRMIVGNHQKTHSNVVYNIIQVMCL